MADHKGLAIHAFKNGPAFERWLLKNLKAEAGLWVKFAKKASGIASISYEDAREVAIIYGWIDGLKNAIDEHYYAIRFTPRRARSKWSKINREIAVGLIKAKRMSEQGLAEVAAAKADGRWEAAYAGSATIEVHPALAAALAKSKVAKAAFTGLNSANRYAILYSVADAKQESTRTRRIDKFVAMLERGEVPHPG